MKAQARKPEDLSEKEKRMLFSIFEQHYDCVTFDNFTRDLLEKDFLLVLNNDSHEPVGFTTILIYESTVSGVSISLVFSGDTIIHQNYWGSQELVKAWCSLMGELKRDCKDKMLYWLLISKGYKTYLYLPLFAKNFYPRANTKTPFFEQKIMDSFCSEKYSEFYNASKGIISFNTSRGHLKPNLAKVPAHQFENEDVQFFLEKNPNFFSGDELVCVTEISEQNMKSIALRYFNKSYNQVLVCK